MLRKAVLMPSRGVAVLCLGATVYIAAVAQQAPARRPNILLVIMDDVGLDVTTDMYPGLIDGLEKQYGPSGLRHPKAGAIHGRPASTPNLDAFARKGMVFSSAWVQPFCSPTRASILTGLFAVKVNVLTYADPLSQNHASFVEMLKDKGGYSTGIFGKWHLAGLPANSYSGMKPKEAGFEVFKGNMHAALNTYWDYDYMEQDAGTAPGVWRTGKPPVKSLPGIAPTTYAPVVQAADALEWITAREKEDPKKPWFAWVASNLSHATTSSKPTQMPAPNKDTLDAKTLDEMSTCGANFGSMDTGKCTGEAVMRASTNSLDTVFGKLVAQVDALDPNTYVMVLGDNGTPMYGRPNLDFIDNMYITAKGRGKGTAYESGARVALAIRGPKIAAGKRSGEYVDAVDLFSTILGFAGLEAPKEVPTPDGKSRQPLDSISLTPILFGKATTVRDPNEGYLLTESLNLMTNSTHQVGARNATYKVICNETVDNKACEFFDLRTDPLEEYPLAKPESCADYTSGKWTPKAPEWHFCRLREVIAKDSFLLKPLANAVSPGAGRGGRGGRGPAAGDLDKE
jgi:arylsulfatase A-like enzyme